MRAGFVLLLLATVASVGEAGAAITRPANGVTSATATATSITPPHPAGAATGDLLIAQIAVRGNATIAAPAGWTAIAVTSTANLRQGVYYAFDAPALSRTFTFNSSQAAVAGIVTYKGVDTTAPLDVAAASGTVTSGTTVTAPAVNTVTANTQVVAFFAAAYFTITTSIDYSTGGTITYNELYDVSRGAGAAGVEIQITEITPTQAATGSTKAIVATRANAAHQSGVLAALRPALSLAAFQISVSGSASTCAASNVTITAKSSGGATFTGYTGTISISTSTANGDWTVGTASGTLTAGASDSGTATYTFVAADSGDIVLNLTDQHAENLSITVSSGAITATSSTVQFRDNALVVTSTDAIGSIPVAGRPHSMNVALWRRDSTTGNCSIATNYANSHSLKAWLTLNASQPAGAVLPGLTNAGGTTVLAAPAPTAVPGTNNLTLTFNSGQAAFNLITTDVGKYVLNIRDDSGMFAGAGVPVIDGASPTLTVRPFGFYVTVTGNTGATTPAGTIFKAAGSNFTGSVTAVQWAAADDANNDGIPDAGADLSNNIVLTRYTWATTLTANPTGFQPSTGTVGTVNNGAIAAGGFANGSATVNTLQYTEVGSFTLRAAATGYLGTAGANISDNGGLVVGRFTPFDFLVTNNTPQFAAGCVSGAFTYVGQSFTYATQPVFTVTARNALGGTTRNYTGTWWKITTGDMGTLTPLTQATRYTAFTGTLNVSGLPAVESDPAIADLGNGAGTLTFGAGTGFSFTRSGQVVPFNADIALSITVKDADAIAYASNPAHFGTATAGNGIAFAGGKAMKFGRLLVGNAIGSEFLDLPIPISTQFWTSGGFVTNNADSCTTLANTPVALSNFQGNQSACTTAVSPSSTLFFANGKASLKLTKPGSNKNGSLDLTVNLGAATGATCTSVGIGNAVPATVAGPSPNFVNWLQGNWGGSATFTVNPMARATFGQYRNSQEFIYLRENH